MSKITMCPSCNEPVSADTTIVGGSNFCEHCDEPLFWRPVKSPDTADVRAKVAGEQTRRSPGYADPWPHDRLPSVHGRASDSREDCWNCGEPNYPPLPGGTVVCRLCGSTIPKPKEPTPPLMVEVDCSSKEGARAHRSWEVPDKLLVAVGVLLVALTVLFVAALVGN